ncbi:transcription factor MYB13-like [Oryza brachyantha]|nr:transcription factor MYB13-like [Oryza brachyantha]XP_015698591.1 transcription factor MYB13-like [Oryza brachyantha]
MRSAKSCNSRWNDYLRDKSGRGNFTKEEDDTIASLQQAIGNRWSIIAEYLPRRSSIEIKNYWRHLKKRVHWISNRNGRSEIVVLPNSNIGEKKMDMSWENESSTSTRSNAAGKELVRSVSNLEQLTIQEANSFNNNVPGSTNLSNEGNNCKTDGEDLGFLHDFESYSFEDMSFSDNILDEDCNLNYGGYVSGSTACLNNTTISGEGLALPRESNWSDYKYTTMLNNSTEIDGLRSRRNRAEFTACRAHP